MLLKIAKKVCAISGLEKEMVEVQNNVIKLRFYPRLCQFLMKIIPVIN